MLCNTILDAIGQTPLIKINGLDEDSAEIYVKLEKSNPGGSIKDRAVKFILADLFATQKIKKGDTIVEATSGSTGIGLAMLGAALGLHVVIVMQDSMTIERRKIIKAYGAELILTPSALKFKGTLDKAEEICKERNAILFGQFTHQGNVISHAETTAKEIIQDLPSVDVFVAGIGTGGTVSGVGKTLKGINSNIKIYAVEPKASPFLTTGEIGMHQIQGVGTHFIPEVLDLSVIDNIETVSDEEAVEMVFELATTQGILAGISSGANYAVAKRLAKQLGKDKKVVTVLPDSGERYFSANWFDIE